MVTIDAAPGPLGLDPTQERIFYDILQQIKLEESFSASDSDLESVHTSDEEFDDITDNESDVTYDDADEYRNSNMDCHDCDHESAMHRRASLESTVENNKELMDLIIISETESDIPMVDTETADKSKTLNEHIPDSTGKQRVLALPIIRRTTNTGRRLTIDANGKIKLHVNPFETTKLQHLGIHLNVHTDSGSSECMNSETTFNSEGSLSCRLQQHRYRCPYSACNMTLSSAYRRSAHIALHNKYCNVCNLCGQRFSAKYKLKIHKKNHIHAVKMNKSTDTTPDAKGADISDIGTSSIVENLDLEHSFEQDQSANMNEDYLCASAVNDVVNVSKTNVENGPEMMQAETNINGDISDVISDASAKCQLDITSQNGVMDVDDNCYLSQVATTPTKEIRQHKNQSPSKHRERKITVGGREVIVKQITREFTCRHCEMTFTTRGQLVTHLKRQHGKTNNPTGGLCSNAQVNMASCNKNAHENTSLCTESLEGSPKKSVKLDPLVGTGSLEKVSAQIGTKADRGKGKTENKTENKVDDVPCAQNPTTEIDQNVKLTPKMNKNRSDIVNKLQTQGFDSSRTGHWCVLCKKKFKNKKTLTEHLSYIHFPKDKCKVCGQYFSRRIRLKVHMKKNHPEKAKAFKD